MNKKFIKKNSKYGFFRKVGKISKLQRNDGTFEILVPTNIIHHEQIKKFSLYLNSYKIDVNPMYGVNNC